MTRREEIGQLTTESITVEWTIKNVLLYTGTDKRYFSPSFTVPGSEWSICICPNGETKYNSVGWISVYLQRRDDSTYQKTVNYSFAMKKMNGAIENRWDGSYVFKNRIVMSGFPGFLKRSELPSSSDLTIICTLRMKESHECISRLFKLSQDLKDMFISERSCDTTLKVEQVKFSAHKSILTARSPVLAAMFEVDMKEKNTGTVDIVDCQPKPFRDFLLYLYSGELPNHSDDVFELYRIAHKYDVEDLKSACVQCMLSTMSVDNVLKAVLIGYQFDEIGLKNKTQDFFNEHFSKIVSNTKWDAFLKNYFDVGNTLLKNMATKTETKKCLPGNLT